MLTVSGRAWSVAYADTLYANLLGRPAPKTADHPGKRSAHRTDTEHMAPVGESAAASPESDKHNIFSAGAADGATSRSAGG